MAAFLRTKLKDVSFSMDIELNVLKATHSFAGLFDITDININLSPYMDSFDVHNFRDFLSNLPVGATKVFYAPLKSSAVKVGFVFECTRTPKDGIFDIKLQDYSYSKEEFEKSLKENYELQAVLKNFDSYYFIYEDNKFTLKYSKEQTSIYSGQPEDFKNYIISNFNLKMSDDTTQLQMTAMIYDIQKLKTKKSYKLLMTNDKLISIFPIVCGTQDSPIVVGVISTASKTGINENLYSQHKDGLTDMLNKKAITEQASHKINILKEESSLIILDIDKFKDYNDTYGHAYGDKVIVAVANVIKETVKDVGIAGRIGGDEFMIILNSTDEQDIRNVTRNIRTGITWAITSADPTNVVTCSMGIARFPLNTSSYEDLFKLADKCLYIAKKKGRNCYVIYKPELHDKIIIKNETEIAEKSTGQTYSDEADTQLKIMEMLRDDSEYSIQDVIDLLKEYIGVTQITLYKAHSETDFEVAYKSGDREDFRKPYFNSDYFRYFNSYNFLHLDNTINFDVIDKEKHAMYRDSLVASTIEYALKDEKNNVKALMCFDVYKPARTFAKEKVVFSIMMAKILTNLL